MSSWYERRLAEQTGAEPPQPRQFTAPVVPSRQQYQAPQRAAEKPQVSPKEDLIGAMAQYKGGQGARNSEQCPECGSPHFIRQSPNLAQRCMGCGYTDRFGGFGA